MKMSHMMEDISDWLILNDQNEKPLLNEVDGGGNSSSSSRLKKGPWTSAEDRILEDYVKKHGEGNWNNVQKNTGLLRGGKSCRLRWVNHLRPNLKKGAFTAEEERLIVELHAKMGNKWAKMAAQLPGRTDNEIKNFWNTRMKKLQRAGLPLHPPELCSQALPESQLRDGSDETSMRDDGKQQTIVQAGDRGIPEVKFSGLRFDKEHLPCLTDTCYCDMVMKDPACSQYSFPALTNHRYKRLRESCQPIAGHKFSDMNGFSHAYRTQSCDKDSFNPSFMQHHIPASNTKSEPCNSELPSVQNSDNQMGLRKKAHLLSPSLESIHDFPNPPLPMVDCKLGLEIKSWNSGLLESLLPEFNKTSRTATNPSSVMNSNFSGHTSDHWSGRSALSTSKTDWEQEIWEDILNPILPLDSSITSIFCQSSSTTNRQSLPNDEPADDISGLAKMEKVEQLSYEDEENYELSDWFNFSAPDSLIDMGFFCQGAICVKDDAPLVNDPATSILPPPGSGNNDHTIAVGGSCVSCPHTSPYPLSWGLESSSSSWNNMPSVYHTRELH